jgi:uncharacterized protein with NRDE domain
VCTLALYFRIFEQYPLVLAANRDEHFDRPTVPPALWEGKPKIIAGRDLRAGGTWLGFNEFGAVAAILNRRIDGSPLAPTVARSRGLLCTQILRAKTLSEAVSAIEEDSSRYNPFTLVFADKDAAYVAYNDEAQIHLERLQPGLHVFSSAAEFDLHSAKAKRAYSRFVGMLDSASRSAIEPAKWLAPLKAILSDHSFADGSDNPGDAICVHRESSGTVSSSVIFLTAANRQFASFHCPGPPCRTDFGAAVSLALQ